MTLCPCGLGLVLYAGLCRECHEDRVRRGTRMREEVVVPHAMADRTVDVRKRGMEQKRKGKKDAA